MDSAIGMSDVTVAPSDSASQAPKVSSEPPKSTRGGPRKGSHKPGVDKDAPPGAVQVPKAGQSQTGKKSSVVSSTIPLVGWGEVDLYAFRKDVEPTFTADARPYADLVDTTYLLIQSRFSAGGKHIPLGLFRYYCFVLWWMRVLWLHKSNGNVLTTEEKNALNILLAGDEYQVPSYVAQYLGNLGNFVQGGEQFYFRKFKIDVDEFKTGKDTVMKGWFKTTTAGNRVNDSSFWYYAQMPSPGVYATYACNEANATLSNPLAALSLDRVAPTVSKGFSVPTDNIVGWSNATQTPHHSSWRATYNMLGWSASSIPADTQTVFNISTSTLKWVSERLSTLKDFKVHSSRQLVLSVQGAPLQANFLGVEEPSSQGDQRPDASDAVGNRMCASRFSELAVLSRYSMDPKVLPPSFAFGYRIERTKVFESYGDGRVPSWHMRSNFQPWLMLQEGGAGFYALSDSQVAGMNATFDFGSQSFLNVRRFATHQLQRSAGLDAALVLSAQR